MSTRRSDEGNGSDLVVVGSSAGGIEALSVLVSTLPASFPAPIVVAQHLDPTRVSSSLADILQRRTVLTVQLVQGAQPLQAGTIYVTPSNRHVIIRDGHVELEEYAPGRPKPSVDLLLSTAAPNYGERLIAIILTGTGGDGAAGAVDVKRVGGTVIIQNPQTARYPAMPAAIPPTLVDFQVELEQIGPLVNELVTGATVVPAPSDAPGDTLRRILNGVSHQAALDFSSYKSSTILRRIGRRMAVLHFARMEEYADFLADHPEEVGELVQSFLINVTQFFRDAEAFDYLRTEILPPLIAAARERDHVLRFWSAGCATGEEPYSLAMLVADLLGPELPQWSIKIFATDLDEAALNFARRGLYTEVLLKDIPATFRERFFERTAAGWRIIKPLRQLVIFGQQDLSRSAPFPRMDLIVCRNVLIYFTPELQDFVLSQFVFSLGTGGGFLFLGKAETVRPTQPFFELVHKQWKIYRCTGTLLMPPRLLPGTKGSQGAPMLPLRSPRPADKGADRENESVQMELTQLRRATELVLRFLPVGAVVIDRAYRLVTANIAARRLLGLRDMGLDVDFLHAVRGLPYSQVRAAIDITFRERTNAHLAGVQLDEGQGGNGRFLSLDVSLMPLEDTGTELVVITLSDVTDVVQGRNKLEAMQAEQERLLGELAGANRRLNDMNKELVDANEELQVSNEEMMLTHEELQATNEEFEATNEELQATNEELETNNEELQATNEELQTTNDELRARTGELQEMTVLMEGERVRLAQVVELAPFAILILRERLLVVEAFSERYARQLEGRAVLGQPLEMVHDLFWGGDRTVLDTARQVYETGQRRTIPQVIAAPPTDPQRPSAPASPTYTLVPTLDVMGRVDGVTVYWDDRGAS